jgi:hypothetical protein
VLIKFAVVLLISLVMASPSIAQGVTEEAMRGFFSGQQMFVTYREGGALYGTFFTLPVHFCRSGRYMTFGESRRQTILDNEQVNRFTDEGTWDVATFGGRLVLRYLSVSGQPNVVAINVSPDGRVYLGEGISVSRQGPARCAR